LLWDNYKELSEGFPLDPCYIAKETNKYSIGSFQKAKDILGREPKINFDDGIKITVDYAGKMEL
jgi:nucleoside-diphosphate-sugar epimerase